MTVKDMKSILATNKFDNTQCNFKLKTKGPKVTLEDIMMEIKSIHTRLDRLDARIDNLVAKNNLKE